VNDLQARRRFFADEIAAVAALATPRLVEALAAVAREQFLPPGPWLVRGEADVAGAARPTPDADARHVYHNYSIAIDPARDLFNGAPGVVARIIDALNLPMGARVLHVGAGLGYYSAVLAHIVGRSGRVTAVEIDPELAAAAAANLSPIPWVDVRCDNGVNLRGERFDAVLVNSGVTHVQQAWLDAIDPGGRLAVPLTVTMPAMGATLGKGVTVLCTHTADGNFAARVLGFVAIYSGIDLRDDDANARLGQALMRAPVAPFTRLRRDAHAETPGCWLHAPGACFSLE
jgi:protein-L-isoaspartate(D-aspartate) O-methyltransferase